VSVSVFIITTVVIIIFLYLTTDPGTPVRHNLTEVGGAPKNIQPNRQIRVILSFYYYHTVLYLKEGYSSLYSHIIIIIVFSIKVAKKYQLFIIIIIIIITL